MYKTITRLLLIFIAGLLIISCDKKKEEITPANQMSYDGKTHDLSQGIWYSEEYDFPAIEKGNLFLASSSLRINYEDGHIDSFDGKYTGVIFVFTLKKGVKKLESGEYKYGSEEDETPNTFYGYIIIGADPNAQLTDANSVKSGKVVVKRNDNSYEITLECANGSGKIVKGFYKGELINSQ